MLSLILFWWLGAQLNAPTWYYAIMGVKVFVMIIKYGLDMYKKGSES